MDKSPLVTIITPVWNGIQFLKDCVESVLQQEAKEWEMLISDDGSTDGSREYLKSLGDSRITIFEQEKNLGIFGNLNFLFSKANAPICQILCQDDYFVNGQALTLILDYWQTAECTTGFVRFNNVVSSQCGLTALHQRIAPKVLNHENASLWFFVFGNIPGNLSNVSLRTHIVPEFGGFREDMPYAGDFEFWSRAAERINMGIEAELVVHVRRHPGTASVFLNRKGELIRQNSAIISELYRHLIEKYPQAHKSLKLVATLNYDILQRDTAVKMLFKGRTAYYKEFKKVLDKASFTFHNDLLRWFLYFATVGGRIGRTTSAKYLLNRIGFDTSALRNN